MSDITTPAGEAFEAYIDGKEAADNPYPPGTTDYEQWLFEFAKIIERSNADLRKTIDSLLEQVG